MRRGRPTAHLNLTMAGWTNTGWREAAAAARPRQQVDQQAAEAGA